MESPSEPETSRLLVRRVLEGGSVPRGVMGPLAVHWCAARAGVSICDYTLDPRILADCVIRYYEQFQPDAVWLSADTWVSAQAMGASVAFPGPRQPLGGVSPPKVRTASDIDQIPPPDPKSQGRYPLMLQALRYLREALGDRVYLVACFDQYPFSLACALMGIEPVMSQIIEDRPRVESLMERCSEYSVAYAAALADAGADMLSGGDSPAGLIGPRLYREVALPYERRVIAALKAQTTIPISLHICGNAMPLLRDMASSGADVLELDQCVNLTAASRVVGRQITLWGNLDPVGLLSRGSAEDVHAAATGLLHAMRVSGHSRFVLSSGCTLAMETPEANIHALREAAWSFQNRS